MISAKKLLFKACEKIGAIKNEVAGLATTVASHTSTINSHSSTLSSHTTSISAIESKQTNKTISVNTTSSIGTFKSASCKRYGNVVWLQLVVTNNASVESGADVYAGTLSSTLPRPYAFTTGCTYYGNRAIAGSLNAERLVHIRNAADTAVTIGSSNSVTITFTYITYD